MTITRAALAVGLLALASAAGAQGLPKKVYIVQLADAPAATYTGGVASLAATQPAAGSKLDVSRPAVRAYLAYLAARQNSAIARLGLGSSPVLQRYSITYNGFAAALTDAQAKSLMGSIDVKSVVESEVRKLDTTRTPGFLGLTDPTGLWSQVDAASRPVKGEDVIIGMIDSGVWPEDPSFGDKVDGLGKPVAYNAGGTPSYGTPPAKWHGVCTTGPGFTSAMCNNKLLGARFYNASFDASGAIRTSFEYLSPRDGGGHGTHTSSTSGGNNGVDAAINGIGVGAISGIAPRARLATYKVCWEATVSTQTGCYTADTLKAIDDAVADGVDVINYSVSGTQTSFVDPVETAYLNAVAAGVFVAASGGNDGPANAVAHISPWIMTVAASTHDRYTVASVTLGSGAAFSGPSYQRSGFAQTPLILARDAGPVPFDSMNATDQTALQRCYNAADRASFGGSANAVLDPAKVAGKMVVCYRGNNVLINKADAVQAAGGVAMLLQNVPALPPNLPASNNSVVLQPYVIPTVHLTVDAYSAVASYANTPGPTAGFGPGVQQTGVIAPVMASFSSRGPNKASGDILKPDISGPGVDIIAGYLDTTLTQAQHDALVLGNFTPQAAANSLQGTSMSSPHVAGAAALLKQLYPTWSPAAIKSALMTSTNDIKLASGAPDPDRWGYGAGHLNPNASANPGLVYDLSAADYGRFLCGQSLTPPAGIGTCGSLGSVSAWNLNLASLTAAKVTATRTLTRRVTNVSNATATYVATAVLPNWSVSVSPSSLTLAPGASASFNVNLTAGAGAVGTWSFGSLTWNDGTHVVRSPLSANAVGFSAPTQVTDTRTSGSGSKVYSVVSAYTGTLTISPTGLLPATLTAGSVLKNAVQCFNFAVGSGTQFARFQLFNTDTLGGSATDLDLDAFSGSGCTGTAVGSSGGSTSDEVVTLTAPTAGSYSVRVTGFNTPAGGATYTLSSWIVGQPTGTQTLRAAGPTTVYAGGTASIGLGWTVAAGSRYMGTVRYFDGSNALLGTTLVLVDNH